jgi:UDP-N-acetyl-D-glucosamine dehydrogenase
MKKKEIFNKYFRKKKCIVGVIGLGYVGMPLALSFINSGFKKVVGFDIDKNKIKDINNCKSFIWSISSKDIKNALSEGFVATNDFSKISELDAIIICVPTPLNKYGQPELKFLINSINTVIPYTKKGQLISIESTTYPGTTEEELIPKLKSKFNLGKNFFVCYSPEREDPGNESYSTRTIPKVIGGYTKNCLQIGIDLYSQAIKNVVSVSSLKVAEMTKLHENIYRLINIGLVNEMKMICDKMNIDIHEVIEAAKTKPFGFTPFYPGPGVGGHCIPIDPNYLTWKAKQFSVETRFITLAQRINEEMSNWILDKLLEELNLRGKILSNLRVLFLGISYKKNVDDTRESPSIKLINLFKEHKAIISYHDPYVSSYKFNFSEKKFHKSIKLNSKNISSYDLVVISTDHDNINYDTVFKSSKLILDVRGKYLTKNKKVMKA